MTFARDRDVAVGSALRQARADKYGPLGGLRETSRLAGIPTSTLFKVEGGQHVMAWRVGELARALDVTPEQVIGIPLTVEQLTDERLEGVSIGDVLAVLEVCR